MLKKIQPIITIILSISIICMTNGCGDDKEVNSSSEQFTLNQFPLLVGSQWEYEVNDPRVACPACADTFTVSIIDSTNISASQLSEVWHLLKNDSNFTWLQNVIQDSVKLAWDDLLAIKIKFPFAVGDIWKENSNVTLFKDSVIAAGYGSVTTPAGTFDNAFILEGYKTTFESNSQFKIWLVPDVGIVRIDYSIEDPTLGIDVVSQWLLVSFTQTADFNHFSASQFPQFDGSSWDYDYNFYNYNNGVLVDSSVDIIFVNLAESSTVAVWSYQFPDTTIIEYVENNTDTVFVYTDHLLSQLKTKYIFPFSIDQKWVTGDRSTTISTIISFTDALNMFFPTYIVTTEIDCGLNCTIREVEYYTPNVGLIYKTVTEYDSDTQFSNERIISTEVWELISYSIP